MKILITSTRINQIVIYMPYQSQCYCGCLASLDVSEEIFLTQLNSWSIFHKLLFRKYATFFLVALLLNVY